MESPEVIAALSNDVVAAIIVDGEVRVLEPVAEDVIESKPKGVAWARKNLYHVWW